MKRTFLIAFLFIAAIGGALVGARNLATTGQLPKYTDSGGTLGDSTIHETSGGDLGIGTTSPGGVFDLQRNSSSDILQRFWNTGTGGSKLRYVANNDATAQVQFTGLSRWWSAMAATKDSLQFRTLASDNPTNTEAELTASPRLTILQNGNVGVGTTSPAQKLSVAGVVESTTGGFKFPDGTTQTTAASSPAVTLAAGTYTPTKTSSSNATSATFNVAQYLRVGNTVTVSGWVDVDPTATGSVLIYFTLPIATDFAGSYQLAGSGHRTDVANTSGSVSGVLPNKALLQFNASDADAQYWTFSFTYCVN